jgi:hypothetical protein
LQVSRSEEFHHLDDPSLSHIFFPHKLVVTPAFIMSLELFCVAVPFAVKNNSQTLVVAHPSIPIVSTESRPTQQYVFLPWQQFRIVADLMQKRFEGLTPNCTAESMVCLHMGVCVLCSSQDMWFLASEIAAPCRLMFMH